MDIKTLAIEQCKQSTKPEFFENFDDETKLIRGLAKLISTACDYDGAMILEICRDALEDANFHTEAHQLEEILDNLGE